MESRLQNGKKLVSPSATRNSGPIGKELSALLPKNVSVLEIASGTGQHGAHMCAVRPDINWQMSDIDAQSRASQNSYALEYPNQMPCPVNLDVLQENWWQNIGAYGAIYCANMIHIAPWDAALGLAKGAGELFATGGLLYLYGPFLTNTDCAPSNLDFDLNLKRKNPDWGVRTLESVKHIFADVGLNLHLAIDMPRDNFLLVFDTEVKKISQYS